MSPRRASILALFASSASFLGACGPTTRMYAVAGSRPQGLSTQQWALDVDVEECRMPRASAAPPEGFEQGFVELAPGCQLPMHWLGKRERGERGRHFALVGGPYRCTLNDNVGPLSIKGVDGTVAGDDLILILAYNETYRGQSELGDPHQVLLRGAENDSQRSNMICGLPAKP
jgi:hypothetical protein